MTEFIITFVLLVFYSSAFAFLMLCQNKTEYAKYYSIAKTINSILFLVVAFICALENDNLSFLYILLPGFILCLSGDIILSFYHNTKKRIFFLTGLFSFLCGHIAFVLALNTLQRFSVIDFIFPVFALFTTFLLSKLKNMDCGKMKPVVIIYSFFVALLFSKSTHIMFNNFSISTFIFAIGSLLFLVSDIVIMFLYFYKKKRPAVGNMNLFTYYYGMFLIAVSLLF